MEDIDRAFSLIGLRSTKIVEGTDEDGNEALEYLKDSLKYKPAIIGWQLHRGFIQ